MEETNNHEQKEMNVDKELRVVEIEEFILNFKLKTDIHKLLTKNRKDETH